MEFFVSAGPFLSEYTKQKTQFDIIGIDRCRIWKL